MIPVEKSTLLEDFASQGRADNKLAFYVLKA